MLASFPPYAAICEVKSLISCVARFRCRGGGVVFGCCSDRALGPCRDQRDQPWLVQDADRQAERWTSSPPPTGRLATMGRCWTTSLENPVEVEAPMRQLLHVSGWIRLSRLPTKGTIPGSQASCRYRSSVNTPKGAFLPSSPR